jgi:hypothetical protein
MLDLFCGRWGWSRAFAARGWECVGVDLVESPEIPKGCEFIPMNVLSLIASEGYVFGLNGDQFCTQDEYRIPLGPFDFICASSPCEQFSVHGMKHFHPNPPYPELGIKLFNHTRAICEESGVPYVMENVRAAQQFVGQAVHHCGPFYLWGNGVPPIMPQGIIKGMTRLALGYREQKGQPGWNTKNECQLKRKRAEENAGTAATIPPELANCVADYAERLLEVTA